MTALVSVFLFYFYVKLFSESIFYVIYQKKKKSIFTLKLDSTNVDLRMSDSKLSD